jgi:hypothetical protein
MKIGTVQDLQELPSVITFTTFTTVTTVTTTIVRYHMLLMYSDQLTDRQKKSKMITSRVKQEILPKNPAYGRQSISRPMRIVAPMP